MKRKARGKAREGREASAVCGGRLVLRRHDLCHGHGGGMGRGDMGDATMS